MTGTTNDLNTDELTGRTTKVAPNRRLTELEPRRRTA